MKKIGLIVGSLRKDSYNRKIAENLVEMMGDDFKGEIIEIKGLPFYDEDIDNGNAPESYIVFRNKIKEMDGIIFLTPEYNRSISAVMKNAIDVGSRPYGQNAWDKIPAGVVSSSISAMGGMLANHTLRQSLVFVNMPVLQQPEMYLGNIAESISDDGKLSDNTKEYLQGFIDEFKSHVETNSK